MDKSWMRLSRVSNGYLAGVDSFLDFAFSHTSNPRIPCPCVKCKNRLYQKRNEVRIHMVIHGIIPHYDVWILHGEPYIPRGERNQPEVAEPELGDDIHGLIEDVMGHHAQDLPQGLSQDEGEPIDEPNQAAKSFYDLLRDADTDLYPGRKELSKLNFIIKLLHIKCLTRMTTKAVTMILELFKAALPEGANVPKDYYAATKIVRGLGLTYKKIDACPNDCILFWKENSDLQCCPVCGASRWKSSAVSTGESEGLENSAKKPKKVAIKILRYFPLKPRLQRLFMSKKTASSMRWHQADRVDDGVLRHPADSQAWKKFDAQHPAFASDPRNVRLGLAADGMNPFGNRARPHSTWPVILVPYNLPPWMCMKSSFFMLSMIVPGPRAPGTDLDVYLQPLIAELKELWDIGVETYDASKRQNFQLHASLLWTINDFPGYADLSGWSTKGRLACPTCNEHTYSEWLKHGGKWCYMGHRRFLPTNHRWRRQKEMFNGKREDGVPPPTLSGEDIYQKMCDFPVTTFGKSKKRKAGELPGNWKNKSIFFDLPYWKTLLVRHNLDVMHIEKNVCDVVLDTIMGLSGSKDNLKARLDLKEMGIRSSLHPIPHGDKYKLPAACFKLSTDEKQSLCDSWKKIKVSDGFSSNIANCVKPSERNITNLKSHDCHVVLQHFLPLTIRKMLTDEKVRDALIEISFFFKELCSKTLSLVDLERLKDQIVLTLCKLETIFPPAFFVVMMHLPIHLADEAIRNDLYTVSQRRVRGPTTRSYETSVTLGKPKLRVEIAGANPVCDNANLYKATVLGWLKQPNLLGQQPRGGFRLVSAEDRTTFWNRVNDTFEYVEVIVNSDSEIITILPPPPPRESGTTSSAPTPTTTQGPAESSASAPTSTHSSRPMREDPMDCLRVSEGTKAALKSYMAERFNDHRHEIRKEYFDKWQTREERLANPPPYWPDDQWMAMVDHWAGEAYQAIRQKNKANRAKQTMKHTTGSESIPKKRLKLIRETGRPVDEVELYKITHTSRKKNGEFVDDSSRVVAERMDAIIRENTTEEGICTVPTRAAVTQVIPGTKNRERMMGKPVPKTKEKSLTQSDVVRIEREAHDKAAREFDEKLAAMRAEFNARFEAMAHYQSQTHDTSRAEL